MVKKSIYTTFIDDSYRQKGLKKLERQAGAAPPPRHGCSTNKEKTVIFLGPE
jgi:hypothetical protein